jgi:hypothetical protein
VAFQGKVAVPTGSGAEVVRVKVPPVGLPVIVTFCTAEENALGYRNGTPVAAWVYASIQMVFVMAGSGLWSLIDQSWVPGSKPGTGTSRFGAVEAGMLKKMLSAVASPLACWIASRSDPDPASFVFVTM